MNEAQAPAQAGQGFASGFLTSVYAISSRAWGSTLYPLMKAGGVGGPKAQEIQTFASYKKPQKHNSRQLPAGGGREQGCWSGSLGGGRELCRAGEWTEFGVWGHS